MQTTNSGPERKSHYAVQAEFWDCFFGDRSSEIGFWSDAACQYGSRVLAPMCATAEVACGLARAGFRVVCVDHTPEMVARARDRADGIPGIEIQQAEIADLVLEAQPFDFAFLGTGDFHHFLTDQKRQAILANLHQLIRPGGGLGLELYPLPSGDRQGSPGKKTYQPLRPPSDLEIRVWKESVTRYFQETQSLRISQGLFIARGGQVDEFAYDLTLQLFSRDNLLTLMRRVGFQIKDEFASFRKEPYGGGSQRWIVIAQRES